MKLGTSMRPHFKPRIRSHRAQRGAALMIMMVVMVTGLTALLVRALSTVDIRNERQAKTSAALAQAKDALIGYAITYGDTHTGEVHGYLPCPDIDGSSGEGSSESPTCGLQNVSQIGRLPWRTLGLGPLRDGDSECLWYAVSGTYKNSPKTGLMNWDTNGQFQAYAADGTRLDSDNNQVVAVIFAPGTVQDGQDRSGNTAPICSGNYSASAYLDTNTAHGINNASVSTAASAVSKFIQGENDGQVNDRMVFITRQDLWGAMLKRSDFTSTLRLLTQRVAECVADYGRHNLDSFNNLNLDHKSLPWPALISMSDYSVNTNYDDRNYSDLGGRYYAGRVPYRVDTSKTNSHNDMNGDLLMPSLNFFGNPVTNGLNCPRENDAAVLTELERLYPWWKNWKDHLFYALSREYRPRTDSTDPCGSDCVEINGSGKYAGIVMFSGSALSGQNRASTTTNNGERGILSNYLEGRNLSNHPNYGGNNDYQTGLTSTTFNDTLYCIKTDLDVIECP